jgi:hypothetical protein
MTKLVSRIRFQRSAFLLLLLTAVVVYMANQAKHHTDFPAWFTQRVADNDAKTMDFSRSQSISHVSINTDCKRQEFFERAAALATLMPLNTGPLAKQPTLHSRQILALTFTRRGRFGNQVRQLATILILAQCTSDAVVLVPKFMKPYLYWFDSAQHLETNFAVYYSTRAIEKQFPSSQVVLREIALFEKSPLKCTDGRALNRDGNQSNTTYRRVAAALLASIFAFPKLQLRQAVDHLLCNTLQGRKYVGIHLRWKEGNCVQLCKKKLLNGPATNLNKQLMTDLMEEQNLHERLGECSTWNGTNDRVQSCEQPQKQPNMAWQRTRQHCAFCWMETSYVQNQLKERGIDMREVDVYVASDGQLPIQVKSLRQELDAKDLRDIFPRTNLVSSSLGQRQRMLEVSVDALMLALSDTMLFPPVSTFSVMIGRLRNGLGVRNSDTDARNFIRIDV